MLKKEEILLTVEHYEMRRRVWDAFIEAPQRAEEITLSLAFTLSSGNDVINVSRRDGVFGQDKSTHYTEVS